jgi:hypothetical protein
MTRTETALLRGPLRKRESSLWAREANDWYVEPSWCSLRLFEAEPFRGGICDPACGAGNIVRSALAHGFTVEASDLVRRDADLSMNTVDWFDDGLWCESGLENIVCNPPFGLCDDRKRGTHPFVELCLSRASRKVALLLPANWVQGDRRSRWLEKTPLRRVWFLSPRPSMPPGAVIAAGGKPGNGTTDYAWLVWQRDYDGRPEVRWLRRDAL